MAVQRANTAAREASGNSAVFSNEPPALNLETSNMTTQIGIRQTLRNPAMLLTGALMVLFLSACGGGGGGGSVVNTGNPDDVVAAILVKVGGTTASVLPDSPPAASVDDSAPKVFVSSEPEIITTSSGSTATIPVSFSSAAAAAMAKLFGKVGGSSSYFSADLPPGGKAGSSKAGDIPDTFNVEVKLEQDFEVGEFCVQFSGIDTQGLVSDAKEVCVQLVPQLPLPPENDQASGTALLGQLSGAWLSACTFDDSNGQSESAKLGFTFDGQGNYTQFADSWKNLTCSGTPDSSSQAVFGSLNVGVPVFAEASDLWATKIDFIPDAEFGNFLFPCYNLLRVDGDQLLLGIPLGFTVAGQSGEPGSCTSDATRPAGLITPFPFARQIIARR
jgi:hypothetical protein